MSDADLGCTLLTDLNGICCVATVNSNNSAFCDILANSHIKVTKCFICNSYCTRSLNGINNRIVKCSNIISINRNSFNSYIRTIVNLHGFTILQISRCSIVCNLNTTHRNLSGISNCRSDYMIC